MMNLAPVKPLEKSENRFKVGKDKEEILDEEKKLEADFTAILNKITPEKFDVLVKKVLKLTVDTPNKLDMVARLTFEKALTESIFCCSYAKLCKQLNGGLPAFDDKQAERKTNFRRLILNRCQKEFESYTQADKLVIKCEEDERKATTAKKRILGTIRFIGELYIKEMITSAIIIRCVKLLLRDEKKPRPEFIEALCKLLETIGTMFEKEVEFMSLIFTKLAVLSRTKSALDNRHRFMIIDTIELRRNRWVPRIAKAKAKKLDEIRKDIRAEEAQSQGSRGGGRRDGRDRRGDRRARSRERGGRDLFGGGPNTRRVVRPQGSTSSASRRKKNSGGGGGWSTQSTRGSRSKFEGDTRPGVTRTVHQGGRAKVTVAATNSFSGLMAQNTLGETEKVEKVVAPKPVEKKKAKLSSEVAKKKINALLDEFMDSRDMKEVMTCIEELGTKEHDDILVSASLLKSVEKKDGLGPMTEVLMHLVSENRVTKSNVENGFGIVMEEAEDLSMDYPKLFEFVGAIFGQLVIAGAVDLSYAFGPIVEPLIEWGSACKFVCFILQSIKDKKDASTMIDIYKKSGVDLKKIMEPSNKTKAKCIQYLKDRRKGLAEDLIPLITE